LTNSIASLTNTLKKVTEENSAGAPDKDNIVHSVILGVW
jgi:hypothetical protein